LVHRGINSFTNTIRHLEIYFDLDDYSLFNNHFQISYEICKIVKNLENSSTSKSIVKIPAQLEINKSMIIRKNMIVRTHDFYFNRTICLLELEINDDL